jgi:hypothetical protein
VSARGEGSVVQGVTLTLLLLLLLLLLLTASSVLLPAGTFCSRSSSGRLGKIYIKAKDDAMWQLITFSLSFSACSTFLLETCLVRAALDQVIHINYSDTRVFFIFRRLPFPRKGIKATSTEDIVKDKRKRKKENSIL